MEVESTKPPSIIRNSRVVCKAPDGVKRPSNVCDICVTANTNTRSKNSSAYVTRLCRLGTIGRNSAPRRLSRAMASLSAGLAFRHPGLQRQRVKHATHLTLQRLINDLVLLDPGFAAE